MIKKTLGLKISPTSVAWALVRTDEDGKKELVRSGLRQFKDAVTHQPKGDISSAEARTLARRSRILHRRTRNRKADLLAILGREGFCPAIPVEELKYWKQEQVFPKSEELMKWLSVDFTTGRNPYADRHECLHRRLDFSIQEDRYTLGRAIYHLSQHRGYFDKRNDPQTDDKGKVLASIAELDRKMHEAGCEYLGDYFHSIFGKERIRGRYTSATQHLEKEFRQICKVQELPDELTEELHRNIFRMTPLKSCKWSVGRCVYEKDKARCKTSHPLFEEFRYVKLLNAVMVKGPEDESPRHLSDEEKDRTAHLFFRKSKPNFSFAELASELAGIKIKTKEAFGKEIGGWTFNYRLDQSITGCPVTAAIISALGREAGPDNWKAVLAQRYRNCNPGKEKSVEEIVDDVWHMLEFFEDTTGDRQTAWLVGNLSLEDEPARSLASFRLPQEYAALSRKAIRKMLPFLQEGKPEYEAVYLANLENCVSPSVASDPKRMKDVRENVAVLVEDYRNLPDHMRKENSLENSIKDYLRSLSSDSTPDNLWLPNAMDKIAPVVDEETGLMKLGSPITPSLKNPLAMRCIIQAGKVINALMKEKLIDCRTAISFGLSREVNTRNMRYAIYQYQKNNRTRREETVRFLEENNLAATEDNILIHRLWEEQGHRDIVSGEEISLTDAFGGKCVCDYIIPRSLGGGEADDNRILVFSGTADKRRDKLMTEAFDAQDIRESLAAAGWFDNVEKYERFILGNTKSAKAATMKEGKDRAIRQRNVNGMELDYWKSKVTRMLSDTPVDDVESMSRGRYGAVGKYLTIYLKGLFKDVNGIGLQGVTEFRRLWGIPVRNEADRTEDVRSAATLASIDKGQHMAFCRYMKNRDINRAYGKPMERFPLPWDTFVEDVNVQAESCLTSMLASGPLTKQSRKKYRLPSGKLVKDRDGNYLYSKGNTVRGSLHLATFIGLIAKDGELVSVIRKPAESITEKDLDKIISPEVRKKFAEAIETYGSIEEANRHGGIRMNGNDLPVRRVRTKCHFQNLVELKDHQENSPYPHKQKYLVANEENDCMIIHKENGKYSCEIVSNLDVIRNGRKKVSGNDQYIRKGNLVLFYAENRSELLSLSGKELSARLYRVEGLGKQMAFRNHSDLNSKLVHGAWNPDGDSPAAMIQNYNKWPFALEGRDFTISTTGKINFLFND